MKDRNGLSIRRISTEHQYEPGDLIPKVQRFCLFLNDPDEKHDFTQVVTMDETPLAADNMGKTTLDEKGALEVCMKMMGNSKSSRPLFLVSI